VPIRPDGTIEDGCAEMQADVTFSDLRTTVAAAGGQLRDVVLVQIYLTSLAHKPAVDEVYKRYFSKPYPVRACIAVSELPTPGTVIEVVATAVLSD
jgi:enamine deaminase RidA (YjgF/YER057c/UK114 family)